MFFTLPIATPIYQAKPLVGPQSWLTPPFSGLPLIRLLIRVATVGKRPLLLPRYRYRTRDGSGLLHPAD